MINFRKISSKEITLNTQRVFMITSNDVPRSGQDTGKDLNHDWCLHSKWRPTTLQI